MNDIVHNYVISIVGWGFDLESNTWYWIGRNSLGTFWGDYGFFKIKMYEDNLGVEDDCSWAAPVLNEPKYWL